MEKSDFQKTEEEITEECPVLLSDPGSSSEARSSAEGTTGTTMQNSAAFFFAIGDEDAEMSTPRGRRRPKPTFMEYETKKLGHAIMLARSDQEISQKTLAMKVSITKTELQDIELGKVFPDGQLIQKLEQALKTHLRGKTRTG